MENRPKWFFMDSLMRGPELRQLCSKLGFAPPIWHITDRFIERIQSSLDETTLYPERPSPPGEGDRDDGIVLLTDPAALRLVLEEAEDCFARWAMRARNTQQFDDVIQLLRKIRDLLVEQDPIQASMILDLTATMWCGRNWESLPEPLNERKAALDGVLREICLARERPAIGVVDSRSHSLAKAAQAYVANDWMHTRSMTRILASDMLGNLAFSLKERQKELTRWWRNPFALLVAGAIVAYFTMPLAILLWIAAVAGYVAEFRNVSTQSEVERIIQEVQSGFYSGPVLAARLERLNRSRCDVPSILTEVLRVQPGPLQSDA
jgi:hypothetical protein